MQKTITLSAEAAEAIEKLQEIYRRKLLAQRISSGWVVGVAVMEHLKRLEAEGEA